jgi:hypothetical protein
MDDEPEEPNPKQQQKIINTINEIVVEKPFKKEVEETKKLKLLEVLKIKN